MRFFSDDVVQNKKRLDVVNLVSAASHLVSTKQFLEAFETGYHGYAYLDLHTAAKRILKLQMYQLYRLAKTYHSLRHRLKTSFISQKFYDITPDNFEPNTEEILLYLQKPKFIFRFSIWNYNAMCRIFDSSKLESQFSVEVKPFITDFSQIVPYLQPKYLIRTKKNLFNNKNSGPVDFEYVDETFKKFFKHTFQDHETIEYVYSDDYYIHGLGEAVTYQGFVCAIISGFYQRSFHGELYKMRTTLCSELRGIQKKEEEKLRIAAVLPAAMSTYRFQQQAKRKTEREEREVETETIKESRMLIQLKYEEELRKERVQKQKTYFIPVEPPQKTFRDVLKNGFDTIASKSLGKITRRKLSDKNVSNDNTPIDEEDKHNFRESAVKNFSRKKTPIKVCNPKSLPSCIKESILAYKNRSRTVVPDFVLSDYVGTFVLPDGNSIVDNLTKFADGERETFIHRHPALQTNKWVDKALGKDPCNFYSFIVKLLGESCALKHTETKGILISRSPWELPVPSYRLDFIKKSYCAIVPEKYWSPTLNFNYISPPDKEAKRIEYALSMFVNDYRKVFDIVEDAITQKKIIEDEKRAARAARNERREQRKQEEEGKHRIHRDTDHQNDDVENKYRSEVAANQLMRLFRENTPAPAPAPAPATAHAPAPANAPAPDPSPAPACVFNNPIVTRAPLIVNHNYNSNNNSSNIKSNNQTEEIEIKTVKKSGKNKTKTSKVKSSNKPKNTPMKPKNPETENQMPRRSRHLTGPNIQSDVKEERESSDHLMGGHQIEKLNNVFTDDKVRGFTREQIMTLNRGSAIKKPLKSIKSIEGFASIKQIPFKESTSFCEPNVYFSAEKSSFDNDGNMKTVDYGPFISRPEMARFIISGFHDNHVVKDYLKMMKTRFLLIYDDSMNIINESKFNFRYSRKSDGVVPIMRHANDVANSADIKIIPFPYVTAKINEETIDGIALYLELFFGKHQRLIVKRPKLYKERVSAFMKEDLSHADALLTYAKDCHLYEIQLAVQYIQYFNDHLNGNKEIRYEYNKANTFDFLVSEFDKLYILYYRILDRPFNEVFDYALVHQRSLVENRE